MQQILQKLIQRIDLTRDETRMAFDEIMTGAMTQAQIAALITMLRMKGESVEELTGAAASMRRHAILVDTCGLNVVDTCGTGGDGANTFNISTASAFVVAGAGIPVAKHGNRAVTSKCGSADVLMELGVNIESRVETTEECIRDAGIGFLFAPNLHPAMKYAGGVRREIGIRTIFNMLGPLTNPAGAKGQLIGVFSPELTEPFAAVLRELGSSRALIVHGLDGMDEITVTAPTRITTMIEGHIVTREFDPLPLIGEYHALEELLGGSPSVNAEIIRKVLTGEKGACRDVVMLNAAAGIVAGGKAETIAEGFELARASLDGGDAMRALEKLIEISKE